MSVAVVACAMLVACGKDEEVPEGTQVTFDGKSWMATDVLGEQGYDNMMMMGAFQNYESETTPWTQGYIPTTVSSVEFADGNHYYFFYVENDEDFLEYNNNIYARWQPETFTESITAIDLTALTLDAEMNGTMYDMAEYVNNEKDVTAKMKITCSNAKWEDVTDAKGMKMNKNMNLFQK